MMKKVAGLMTVIFLYVFTAFSQTQMEKIKMEFEFKIDDVGNAEVVYKQSATAMQWKILNQTIGQNPSLLKRDLMHQLSAYELYDFKFSKDDMNRTFILTFKAKGVSKYKGNGVWDFKIEKEISPRQVSKNVWYLTMTNTEGNVLYEMYATLKLPDNVEKSEITTDEFGKRVLRYKVPVKKELPVFLILGAVSGVLGIVLIGASFVFKPKS